MPIVSRFLGVGYWIQSAPYSLVALSPDKVDAVQEK